MPILRSLLFVPGIRPNMIERAAGLTPDALILDLEDSVPLPEKAKAREIVQAAIPTLSRPGRLTTVRINGFHTGLTEEDLAAVVQPGLDAINLPKPTGPETIRQADAILAGLERKQGMEIGSVKIVPFIESALALLRAYDIATASPRVLGLNFGAEDFTLDMGITRTLEGTELVHARTMVALAARAANVLAFDSPYMAYQDAEGLLREAQSAKQLGYKGKYLIHPSQIAPINQFFRPSEQEVEEARKVVEAYETGVAQGLGAISLEGMVIDVPVYERARSLLQWAEAVAQNEAGGG